MDGKSMAHVPNRWHAKTLNIYFILYNTYSLYLINKITMFCWCLSKNIRLGSRFVKNVDSILNAISIIIVNNINSILISTDKIE